MHCINKAAKIVGSRVALSRILGVRCNVLSNWILRNSVPPQYCMALERASNGVVMRWDLRPNDWHLIWPELARRKSAPPIPSASAK